MNQMGQLQLSSDAIGILENQAELAEIVFEEGEVQQDGDTEQEDGITQAALESGLTKAEIFTFDRFPALYLNARQILKIKQKGKLQIIEDSSERRPTYSASANLCLPHLYVNGEMSPLDFGDYVD